MVENLDELLDENTKEMVGVEVDDDLLKDGEDNNCECGECMSCIEKSKMVDSAEDMFDDVEPEDLM